MNINVTLVKTVGEVDNNSFTTEYFKVYKLETLLIQPQLHTRLTLKNGTGFRIDGIGQDFQKYVVYLYEFTWHHYRKFNGDKEEFDKLKIGLLKEGWSPIDKHPIIAAHKR